MKPRQKPTEVQAELIRRAGLDPETVTVTSKNAAPPLAITYHGDGKPLHYWIVADGGALRLSDTKPDFRKPRHEEDGEIDAEANTPEEPLELEKKDGKWRQTGKRALSDGDGQPAYNPVKLEADLRRQGYDDKQARAIVAQVCDGDTIREAAKKVGLSHGAVGALWLQCIVKRLRSGNVPPTDTEEAPSPQPKPSGGKKPLPGSKPLTLADCARWARCEIDRLSKRATAEVWANCLPELLARNTPDFDTPAFAVAMIRDNPAALLTKEGRPLLEALVDLLEAAKSGDSARRIPKLIPEGTRKRVKEKAQKILALLTKPKSGGELELPAANLADCVKIFRCRVTQLKAEYRKTFTLPRAVRLEKMRKAHRAELRPFTDKKLQFLLHGNLLKTAARLAEGATRISAEACEKAYREVSKEHKLAEQAEKFARGQAR